MKNQIAFVKELKNQILKSRYKAAHLANQELLKLYFQIGKMLDDKVKSENWGAGVLKNISAQLQEELPGLRGFSYSNLKKMRLFFLFGKKKFQLDSQ